METLSLEQVQTAVKAMAETAEKNRQYYSDLDADGDCGETLATGFKAVVDSWDTYDMTSISSFLMGVRKAASGSMGGSSGGIWGMLFMRMSMTFRNKEEITASDIHDGIKNAIEGIMKIGGAHIGDKTMLDALDAERISLESSLQNGDSMKDSLTKAAKRAFETREETKDWRAKSGRAGGTGDGGAGKYDPGIVAIGDMAMAIVNALA